MNQTISITNDTGDFKLSYKMFNDVIYFKAREVALILGYTNTTQAMTAHVSDDYKYKLEDLIGNTKLIQLDHNDKISIYITEPGLYQLIFKSHLPIAKDFTKWVVNEVLPNIRKHGSYTIPTPLNHQLVLKTERDLHYKVIDFIRNNYPDIVVIPGLGEYQSTSSIRHDAYNKGYLGGQPDLLVLNLHKSYSGFALEMKTPAGSGILSNNQQTYLNNLKLQNFKTMVSDNYDDILINLINYFRDIRIICGFCNKKFKNKETLATHQRYFHRITNTDD